MHTTIHGRFHCLQATPVLILLLLAGCGTGVRHQSVPGFPGDQPFRLALLPLTNLSTDPSAADAIGNAFAVEMLHKKGFIVIDGTKVSSVLSRHRIRYADRMTTEQLEALGEELDIDGILVGAVHAYEYRQDVDLEVPVVSVHARIIAVADGRILWVAEQTRAGTDGEFILGIGLEKSLTRLGARVTRDIVDTL